jgi:serine/threonine-protein kinase
MPLAAGERVGAYEILVQIGAGGMGEVYRATDTKLRRDVAIKVLPHRLADSPELLARFEREARMLASLNHPNIATLYGFEQAGNTLYLAMELVPGDTLAERIARGPVPLKETLAICRQLGDGLEAAHKKGITHRDVKPANIKVTPEGRVKILDFGLAKSLETERLDSPDMSTVTAGPTREGQVLGTPAYMSPEQVRGKPVDHRSDIWAFGCVLYELLSGRRAFRGETMNDTLAKVLEREPDWSSLPPSIPPPIQQLLRRCLQKETSSRCPAIAEVTAEIDELVRSLNVIQGQGEDLLRSGKNIRALAVLPLANLSGDPQEDYFADGMTDALITTLAQIGALRVISRTSVMQYKGTRKPLPEIARELNVQVILEGSVLRSANRVRIAAQLIDALTDTHMWAKTYESDMRDILGVQSEVAQAVAQEIRLKLTPQERARFSAARPVDPEAYEAFLKGRHYWYKRSPDALKKGLECLQQAVAKDPTYALSHAGLADAYASLGWDLFAAVAPVEAFPKAKRAAQKALALDPDCAEAHAQLGHVAGFYEWDWATAETAFRRALDLKPQYGVAHIWYSHVLHAVGRTAEAFAESQRAVECDPLGLILNVHLGWNYLYDRSYKRAIEQLQKTKELEPGFLLARLFLGEAYEQTGRLGEAIAEFETAVDLSERRPVYLSGLGHAYAAAGGKDHAVRIIEELQQLSSHDYVPARGIAEIYIGLGEKQHAFAWLDKAVEQRNGWLFHVKSNPRYDSLRSDHRYAELVDRIGLP